MNTFLKKIKKINFQENRLVVCELATVIGKKVLEYGTRYTSWDYHEKVTYVRSKRKRILIWERLDCYGDPLEEIHQDLIYHESDMADVGEVFVCKPKNLLIQYDPRITLTEKEKKTKKISLKRLEEIEGLLS